MRVCHTSATPRFSLFSASTAPHAARAQAAQAALPGSLARPPIRVIPVLANRRRSVIIVPSGVTLIAVIPRRASICAMAAASAFVSNTLKSLNPASTRPGSAMHKRPGDRQTPPPPRCAKANPPASALNPLKPSTLRPNTRPHYTRPGTPRPIPNPQPPPNRTSFLMSRWISPPGSP